MSSDLPIPAPAIEAAARAIHDRWHGVGVLWGEATPTERIEALTFAEAALRAAAPILAGAWAAALTERLVVIRTEADEIECALISEPEDNQSVNGALYRAGTIEKLATRTARQLLALTAPKEPTA